MSSSTLRVLVPPAFRPLLNPRRFKGARGGRGSAKSHFFAERLISECVGKHIRATCVRETQNSIKDSVKQLLEDKIAKFGLLESFRITEREITGPCDSLITFRGLQNHNASSIKSLEGFNRAWTEEAQTISQRSLDLLTPTFRAKGAEMWFSWNPNAPTDPVEKLFEENKGEPDFSCVSVNFDDNPWFPDDLRRDMERDKRRDPEKYAHVWLGQYQRSSEARVFRNWRIGARDEFILDPPRWFFGADFGFSSDPTVLIRCYIIGRTLYVDREAYAIGCEIDATPALFGSIPNASAWPIVADCARPETISYCRRHGFKKMLPARKGAGSLVEGLEFLKNYDIVVHPDCRHTIDELTFYSFKTCPLTSQVLPILEDKKNHVIDALRYALEPLRRANIGLH